MEGQQMAEGFERLAGRQHERGRLLRLCTAARRGQSAPLLLHGPRGIGKSALIDALLVVTDIPVMALRPDVDARRSPYGAVGDLLQVLDDTGGYERTPDAVGARLADAVGSMAAGRPLLLVVDDLGSCEPSSAEAIVHAAVRLRGTTVAALLVIGRTADLPATSGMELLELPGLSPEAAAQIVVEHCRSPLAAEVIDAVVERADGNPLALRRLARHLTSAQAAGIEPLPGRVAIHGDTARLFDAELQHIGPDGRHVLRVLSAAPDPPWPAILDRRHEPLPPASIRACLDTGLLRVREGVLEPAHPLVCSAVWETANSGERRRAHAAVATMPDVSDAARLRHLALARIAPDPDLAAQLDDLAGTQLAAGAASAAATSLRLSADLSVDDTLAHRRRGRAGLAAASAGSHDLARQDLRAALEHEEDAGIRVDLTAALCTLDAVGGHPAAAHWRAEQEADRQAPERPAAAAELLLTAGLAATTTGDLTAWAADCTRAMRLGGLDGAVGPVLAALYAHGLAMAAAPTSARWVDLAAAMPVPSSQDRHAGAHTHHLAWALMLHGRLDEAEAVCRTAERIGGRSGPAGHAIPLGVLAEVLHRRGRWSEAHDLLDEAIDRGTAIGLLTWSVAWRALRARLGGMTGDLGRARTDLDEGFAIADRLSLTGVRSALHAAAAVVALAEDDVTTATAHLEQCRSLEQRLGWRHPDATRWRLDHAAALRLLPEAGARGAGQADIDILGGPLSSSWTAGAAALARAWAHPTDAVAASLAWTATTSLTAHPFDRARAQLEQGIRLPPSAPARAVLEQARSTFATLGAVTWRSRCEAALAAIDRADVRSGWADVLTAAEAAVVRSAASGARNVEIAASLGVSVRTVENHLHRAYRKLEVRGRTGLVDLVAAS